MKQKHSEIDLKAELNKHTESYDAICEYFKRDEDSEPAQPIGDLNDFTDQYWYLFSSNDEVRWAKTKEDIENESDEIYGGEVVWGTCVWETDDFAMISIDNGSGEKYTVIFDQTKRERDENEDLEG